MEVRRNVVAGVVLERADGDPGYAQPASGVIT